MENEDLPIERTVAMCSRNIVNQGDVLKDQERILGGSEPRIKGIVVGLLSDAQANLARELHGIALEVMQPVMDSKSGFSPRR